MEDKIINLPSIEQAIPRQTSKHNLPAQLTPFIGREQEVAAACTLLRRSEVRLLTLTGIGGVGKTRLSLQVAAELLEDFVDGVYFVSLAPISDPNLVIPTIAQTLGLREARNLPLQEQLKVYLRNLHILLLLDNFEQVQEAATRLAELLATCSVLKILVTSRAVLRIRGEHEFLVPPLAVPDLKQLPDIETMAQYAAVALFLQRARAIRPDFQFTQANAHAVAEICMRLDGLPLAIELAVPRIKLLSPQALAVRLSKRLCVLTSVTRDLPARQQTLRNTIAWSYDLLDVQEQQLFRALSVFVGGCTLETAEAMYRNVGDEATQVLQIAASLLDKSLVQQTVQEDEMPRLLMLETIREYGQECLQACGELEAMQQAHAFYYLALAEEANRHLFSVEAHRWLKRLEREHENLRAALDWALESKDDEARDNIEIAVRLGWALWRFWTMRGYLSEGRTFLERVLTASERSTPSVREKALLAMIRLAWHQEDFARVEEICEEALPLCQQFGDQGGIASSFFGMAGVALHRHKVTRARTLAEEALAIFRTEGDNWTVAAVLLFLGRLASAQSDYPRAKQLFEEALILYRRLGYQGDIAWPLLYMARDLITQGEQARARPLLEEALLLCRNVGNKWALAHALGFLGQVILEQGDMVSAKAHLTESLRLNQEVGNQRSTAWSLFLLAAVVALEGDVVGARVLYEQSLSIAATLEHRGLIASCLQGLAAVVTTQGQPTWAARLWGAAETVRQNNITSLPQVLRASVEHAQANARRQLSDQLFTKALYEGQAMTLEQVLAVQGTAMIAEEVPKVAQLLTREPPLTYPAGLTAREVEVLRLVTQGLTNTQIAERLTISLHTVNAHVRSIFNKLGVNSRLAVVRYAVEQHLV